VRVRTPGGDVLVEDGALARVDVEKDDEVRVMVRRGRVTADPEHGDRQRARAGQMFYLESAGTRVRIADLGRDEFDAFDDWVDERVAFFLDRELPRGVGHYVPGVLELADYGDWIDYEGERCWRPRHVADDWCPYRHGYWGFWRRAPIWMSYDPWGYTTCHYGRWTWADRYGWLWRPDLVWGPAWVRWATCGDDLLWAPVDRYDRVCCRRRPVAVGELLIDTLVWSLMPRDNFYHRDWRRIVCLDRAPRVRIVECRPVHEVVIITRDLRRDCWFRGRRQIDPGLVVASERFRYLERKPARRNFRIAEIRHRDFQPDWDRGGERERVLGAREEIRSRVRRQVNVPQLRITREGEQRGDRVGSTARDLPPAGRPEREGVREPERRPGDRLPAGPGLGSDDRRLRRDDERPGARERIPGGRDTGRSRSEDPARGELRTPTAPGSRPGAGIETDRDRSPRGRGERDVRPDRNSGSDAGRNRSGGEFRLPPSPGGGDAGRERSRSGAGDRERERSRALDAERERSRSLGAERSRERERQRALDAERDRERERQRALDQERARERERDRTREWEQQRARDERAGAGRDARRLTETPRRDREVQPREAPRELRQRDRGQAPSADRERSRGRGDESRLRVERSSPAPRSFADTSSRGRDNERSRNSGGDHSSRDHDRDRRER
jgi:hypothetical protein